MTVLERLHEKNAVHVHDLMHDVFFFNLILVLMATAWHLKALGI